MAQGWLGQQIVFKIVKDDDTTYADFDYFTVTKSDNTVAKVAKKLKINDTDMILRLNDIRSDRSPLKLNRRLRVPGKPREVEELRVFPGDEPPRVTAGYAKFDVVDRPGRTGLQRFVGYDPIMLEVAIRFESPPNDDAGKQSFWNRESLEEQITLLERMAGRGNFAGASVGPPPVLDVSAHNEDDKPMPLIPSNYQASRANPTAPFYRIADIDWDPNPLRNFGGGRFRQLAVVSLQQYVSTKHLTRSVAARSRERRLTNVSSNGSFSATDDPRGQGIVGIP